MSSLDISGAYCGVQTFKAASNIQDTTRDAVILEHLLAASRDIEQQTLRHFFPSVATNFYRWPSLSIQNTSSLWLEDDLLNVTSLQAQASGNGAVPVALTRYYLESQRYGPPYSRIEVDLSYNDVFTSGPTPQRSIAVTGQWGYSNATVPCGTLSADITSGATSLTASVPSALEAGDVLLIDSEAIYVDLAVGVNTQVLRRGVNGTVAVAHLTGAAISKYQAPAGIRRVVRADAILSFQQDLASWGRTIGAGDMAVEAQGKAMKSLRENVIDQYQRKRTAAI